MKKIYFYNFLLGLGVGLFFIFAPPILKPVGNLTEAFSKFLESILPKLTGDLFLMGIQFFLISIPFFIGFVLTSWFKKNLRATPNRVSFLFLSFLSFSFGTIVAYLIFAILIIIAFSQFKPTLF